MCENVDGGSPDWIERRKNEDSVCGAEPENRLITSNDHKSLDTSTTVNDRTLTNRAE